MLDDNGFVSPDKVIREEGHLPDCVVHEGFRCWDCPFGDWRTCPVLGDPDFRSYLRWQHEREVLYRRRRGRRIQILTSILNKHKLSLHWELVAKIAMDEAPNLFDSPQAVRQLLCLNQRIFRSHE
jgi:hypothetical protein